uniref:Uncharacterized protein n=1 Tax=Anguilla anguilla TaxID=7936 RepID=A0A0E9R0Z3_ANGAN
MPKLDYSCPCSACLSNRFKRKNETQMSALRSACIFKLIITIEFNFKRFQQLSDDI